MLLEIPSSQRHVFMPRSTVKGETWKDSYIAVTRARRQMSTHLALALLNLMGPKLEILSLSRVGAVYLLPLSNTY